MARRIGGGVAAGAQAVAKAGTRTGRAGPKAVAETPQAEPAPVSELTPETEEPAILQRLDATPKWSGAVVAGGLMLVAGLSVFAIRGLRRRKQGLSPSPRSCR